jgi:hypothetical protein
MLTPLGMTRSSFAQPLPPELAGDLAGSRNPRQPPFIVPYPAGSLQATVTDMGRFLIAQLNGGVVDGRQVFSPAAVTLLQGRHWGDARVQGAAFGFFESWMRGEHALFHTGDSGHHGLLWLVPAKRVGVYVVYATGDAGALELREEIARAALDGLGAAADPPVADARVSDLGRYAGHYAMNGVPVRSFEHVLGLVGQVQIRVAPSGDRLLITPPGLGTRVPAIVIGRDLFHMEDGGTLAFMAEPGGAVTGFTMTGSIWDPQGFHRVGWLDGQPLAMSIVVAAVLALACRVCLSVWDFFGRRRRSPVDRAPWAWRLSGWLPLLLLLVPITAVTGMLLSPPPYTRVPGGIRVAFWMLSGLSIGCLSQPILAVLAWRDAAWRPGRRWVFAVFSVSVAALGWLLVHWGLASGA